ncbi:MAG TPA: spore coat protein [Firmicutes bacterium]|nr:spore coat protein [Bacillota bacterium]
MTIQLTQKEKMQLEDLRSHEEICIKKYNSYAQQAQDPELARLFINYAGQEQQHYNTVNQILSGQVPAMQHQQGQVQPVQGGGMETGNFQNDASLCSDLLMTEKYVSGAYNTAIFECIDPQVRQALNHIQKEEQQHGEGIFKYMQSKGMYNPQ